MRSPPVNFHRRPIPASLHVLLSRVDTVMNERRFAEPLTPVTQTSISSGMSTSIPFRLCSSTLNRNSPFLLRDVFGLLISVSPVNSVLSAIACPSKAPDTILQISLSASSPAAGQCPGCDRSTHHLGIVFYNEYRISDITQVVEKAYQPVHCARMQADRSSSAHKVLNKRRSEIRSSWIRCASTESVDASRSKVR